MRLLLPMMACLGLATTATAQKKAKNNDADPLGNINITVDMIAVPRAEAFALVRQDSPSMWAKVTEMVKAGTASSEYLFSVTTVPGERSIMECILELRYPIEFVPPEPPPQPKTEPALPVAPPAAAGNPPPAPQGEIAKLLHSQLFPTAFETRNTGGTMEILPQLSGKGIFLELLPSRTLLDRFISYPLGAEKSLLRADQPQFQTYKVQTQVWVESGKPLFLAAGDMDPSREGKNADKVLLFFVTATFEPAK